MTDKQTGARAAADEIDKQYAAWMTQLAARRSRVDAIEAIILKHCPQDKVGRLVEAARNVVVIYHRAAITCETVDAVIKLEVALADHEGAQQ